MRGTTRTFALDGPEYATTAVAAVVSSAAYLTDGLEYLSRGVIGDLLGFAVLASVGLALGRRLRHEALLCLACIGGVLLLDPAWPVEIAEPYWWGAFSIGLAAYLSLRRTRLAAREPASGRSR